MKNSLMQNHKHDHNVLDTNKIGRLLMVLTMPMFFGMLIQNIYQITDAIFIGRYVGKEGLAALAIIMPIQMMIFGLGNMVSIGGASLISRLLGQKDQEKAERALGNSIFFSIAFSVLVTVIIVPFVTFWLGLVGVSDKVLPYAKDYLTIIMSGTIVNLTGVVLIALARAEGNARVSMIYMIIQAILNVILDAVFMIVMDMGIAGAALAMVISQGIALIYALSYYVTGNSYLKIRWRNFKPDVNVVRGIFAIGISQFIKAVVDCVSATVIVKMVGSHGGDVGLSTFSILVRIMTLASMPGMVLGQAMQPMLGFNFGAGRFRPALKSITYPVLISTGFGILALLILVIMPGPIIRLFTPDAALISTAISASHIMFLGLPVFGFFNVGQMVFPSIGKAMATFLISVLRPVLFITPLALILPHFFSTDGVWMTFPVSDTMSFLFVLGFIIPLIRKFRQAAMEKQNNPPVTPVPLPVESTDSDG